MKLLSLIPRKLWPRIVAASVLAVLTGVLNAALIAVINRALPMRTLTPRLGAMFVLLCALVFAARVASQRAGAFVSNQLSLDLRVSLSRQVMDVELKTLEATGRARLIGALTDDLNAIGQGLNVVPPLIGSISVAVATIAYLAWLSPKLVAVVFGVGSLAAWVYSSVRRHLYRVLNRRLAARDELHAGFDAAVSGAAELRLNNVRHSTFLSRAIQRPARIVRDLGIQLETMFSANQTFGTLMFFLVIGLVLFLPSGVMSLTDSSRSGAVLSVLFLFGPLEAITGNLQYVERAEVAVASLRDLGIEMGKAAGDAAVGRAPVDADWREIRLVDVEHAYPSEVEGTEFRLGPINLTIQRGQIVFIVGGNGSGKSTLAKVFSGLYVPDAGSIYLGEERITAANLGSYRELFSAIFTNYHLFPDLSLLKRDDVNQQATRLLAKLRLSHKVSVTDGRLTTTNLSTGQKKRLALLISYLEDRPIYIFDEWASDQDPVFRNFFYTELLPELREAGKTVVAITHDDRYFPLADEVIKMDAGKVSEEDTSTFMWRLTK